jgi:hypothetical protein
MNKQKAYPLLMILGASILLFRTIRLLTVENGWETLAIWVITCTFIEMVIDLSCIAFSVLWFINIYPDSKKIALKLGAAAAIFHAFRVLIYVLGRVGPFQDFDLKPQFRHTREVEMFWVYFASILSIMGVLGVIIIWRRMKNSRAQARKIGT